MSESEIESEDDNEEENKQKNEAPKELKMAKKYNHEIILKNTETENLQILE